MTKSSKRGGLKLPLVKGFFATTYFKAFILNAITVAIIAALSIEVRSYLDYVGRKAKGGWDLSDSAKTLIVFVSAFSVAIVVYVSLYVLVGFGGGMLTSTTF